MYVALNMQKKKFLSQSNKTILNGGICNKCGGRILGRTDDNLQMKHFEKSKRDFINYSKH